MKDGYIRVSAASIMTNIGNVTANLNQIKERILEAHNKKAQVIVFPELALTGYTCEDLFNDDLLLEKTNAALDKLITFSQNLQLVIIVGLPYQHNNSLYNVAAIIQDGKLLGLVPKTHVPSYLEFYESRRFSPAPKDNQLVYFNDQEVPFGTKYIFQAKNNPDFSFGIELCEDLWLPNSPSNDLALNGAKLIFNLSASNELATKKDYRRLLVQSQSAKLICGYIYTSSGNGESTTDLVFSGHHLICENGVIFKESKGFEPEIITADLDLKKLTSQRRKMSTFQSKDDYQKIYFTGENIDLDLNYYYDPTPFVPGNKSKREQRCQEIYAIQTQGLIQRLKATKIKKVVIGISGGLDSTLALLVCVQAFNQLNYDLKDIYAITMPCFGTSTRTKTNALALMSELGVSQETIDITEMVMIQFKALHQDINNHDVTYENVQARQRTQILMNKANQINGLVIGTGDLSEVALGWSTYNGDHMSMYAVNVSVPKTLIRYLVDYSSTLYSSKLVAILQDILHTPVSPELLPATDNQIAQKTEDIIGPYELHDFFIYHFIRFNDRPRKIYRKALLAFGNKYDPEILKKWLQKFYWRFFTQQFKRSCIPDGPKVGTVSLSPRGDWRMPSDSTVEMWIKEIESL